MGASGAQPAQVVAISEAPESVWADLAKVMGGDGIVVYPTETFYALGCRPEPEPLARLWRLKARDPAKPVALIAASVEAASQTGILEGSLRALAEALWPGPLTLALTPHGRWPAGVVGPHGTIGVRVPSCSIARRLAAEAGGWVTATSANLSGEPPPTHVGALASALTRGVDRICDAGATPGGLPSTVVGWQAGLVVHRPGAVSLETLHQVLSP